MNQPTLGTVRFDLRSLSDRVVASLLAELNESLAFRAAQVLLAESERRRAATAAPPVEFRLPILGGKEAIAVMQVLVDRSQRALSISKDAKGPSSEDWAQISQLYAALGEAITEQQRALAELGSSQEEAN